LKLFVCISGKSNIVKSLSRIGGQGGPKSQSSYRFGGYLLVVIASLMFAVNGNISRILFDAGVSPTTLVEFRMMIGGALLFGFMLVGKRSELKMPHGRQWFWVLGFGLSLVSVTYVYFVAISRMPIAIVLVIQFSAPIWMTLGEAIWFRRKPSLPIIFSLLTAFGGTILLTGVWQQGLHGMDSIGLFYALLALLTFIAYLILGGRVARELPALSSTAYGALISSIVMLVIQPPWRIPASTWQPEHLGLIALVGIIGMAVPFAMEMAALRRIDATRVGIVAMLELVAAGAVAYFWLDQHLDLWQIAGCVLVVIGILVLQTEKLSPEKSGNAVK